MEWINEQPASIQLKWTLHKLIKWYLSGGSGQIRLPAVRREIIYQ